MKALEQMIRQVNWSPLDYLVIDLPPGTGDIQLTLCQNVLVDSVILVSTPQQLSFDDVQRAAGMFHTVNVPLMGIVLNMTGFKCPCCETITEIFPNKESMFLKWNILEKIPIDPMMAKKCDEGNLSMKSHSSSSLSFNQNSSSLHSHSPLSSSCDQDVFIRLANKINDKLLPPINS